MTNSKEVASEKMFLKNGNCSEINEYHGVIPSVAGRIFPRIVRFGTLT